MVSFSSLSIVVITTLMPCLLNLTFGVSQGGFLLPVCPPVLVGHTCLLICMPPNFLLWTGHFRYFVAVLKTNVPLSFSTSSCVVCLCSDLADRFWWNSPFLQWVSSDDAPSGPSLGNRCSYLEVPSSGGDGTVLVGLPLIICLHDLPLLAPHSAQTVHC